MLDFDLIFAAAICCLALFVSVLLLPGYPYFAV
ncbi:hypothetical protein EPIR_2793 [Erwinia piriflorinigrans CFBP 5888]|uniref:Uncharacterized protein n=1 Tax=Erwinia piriflorinigrans CFBP 5888 TaxID=1161919 RepID=V5ZB63_9GAMM|nr:hypothetical protein EPIR_2793 [Erwinia piriflorinigrans CFBP 5888]